MLQALGDPLSLLLLLLGFVLAVTVQGWVTSVLAARNGDRQVQLERRTTPDPRRHVDPFGAVAGLIGGLGWAKPVEPPHRTGKGRLTVLLLAGPLLVLLLGVALLVAFGVVAGATSARSGYASALVFGVGLPAGERALLLVGLSLLFHGGLSLVPLPPLPAGRLLFALAPRSPGWQKAEYQLVERNIGIAVLLALLLIPLAGARPLLPALLDTLLGPLVALVTGGG